MITLRMGSHDPHVVFLQRMLNNALVHDRSIAVLDEDGAFGRLTDAALRRFQSTYTGPVGRLVPDGVAGPLSWRALGLVTELVHPLPVIGQSTGMTCWVVSGGLASGRMTSAIPGQAQFDPVTPDGNGGGLRPDMANLELYAISLGMRLVRQPPAEIEGLEPYLRRGPIIMCGNWVNGGAHAVVISGYYSGPVAFTRMIRVNNSLPVGRGALEVTDYPGMKLSGNFITAFALIVR
ncbi:peptidoglycan-binding protein [Cypionkella psychrotolerans]|uniref:peptidoglycan-binding protein n=1 Tax=Cypionkella psychrotolerans TaxID=1678131 RepID=UPI000B0C64ED|nr:peptidoglycan-binding protein [Cypionkella psychrotolerans]